jgi:chromosome segregation ATPase
MKLNRNNIQLGLIILLIGYLVISNIFKEDVDPISDNKIRIEQLEKERDQIREDRKKLEIELKEFELKEQEWDKTDSLRKIELSNAKKETDRYFKNMKLAEKDRNKAIEKLEEFKNNPTVLKDPIQLITDTKNKINK